MENRAHALLTGLFVIGLGLAAALASFWLHDTRQARTPYLLITQGAVSGLAPYSTVRYRGVEIGQVTTVDFAHDGTRDIHIRIEIQPDIPITANTYATLRYMGITGLAQVELADDGPPDAPRLPSSSASLARIPMRPSLFESLSDAGQNVLTQFQQLLVQLQQLLGPENQSSFRQTMANVEVTTRKLAEFTQRLEPMVQRLPKISEDGSQTMAHVEQIARELEATLVQVRQTTVRLDAVSSLADNTAETLLVETLPATQNILQEIEAAARNLERLGDELRRDPSSLILGRGRAPEPEPSTSQRSHAP